MVWQHSKVRLVHFLTGVRRHTLMSRLFLCACVSVRTFFFFLLVFSFHVFPLYLTVKLDQCWNFFIYFLLRTLEKSAFLWCSRVVLSVAEVFLNIPRCC